MNKKKFVDDNKKYALMVERDTGINHLAILAQAALESGWGRFAPGNMFFGVKDTDGINGNEQLLMTTEYHSDVNVKYPVVISITPAIINGQKTYKYRVKDYFRKYATPYESFMGHARFLMKNKRYSNALKNKSNPEVFLSEIAKAGYATDPQYRKKILWCLEEIKKQA